VSLHGGRRDRASEKQFAKRRTERRVIAFFSLAMNSAVTRVDE
jgi:hypothetical protein